jgi:signal recognition particle subunit SRP54
LFEALGNRLTGVFDKLRRRGALTEVDVQEALREVRVALLEADVALPVVKDLTAKVRERAVGAEVIRSVSPAQQVVKIVNDALGHHHGDDVLCGVVRASRDVRQAREAKAAGKIKTFVCA